MSRGRKSRVGRNLPKPRLLSNCSNSVRHCKLRFHNCQSLLPSDTLFPFQLCLSRERSHRLTLSMTSRTRHRPTCHHRFLSFQTWRPSATPASQCNTCPCRTRRRWPPWRPPSPPPPPPPKRPGSSLPMASAMEVRFGLQITINLHDS